MATAAPISAHINGMLIVLPKTLRAMEYIESINATMMWSIRDAVIDTGQCFANSAAR